MAVSGLPEPCQSHALRIARLALDIMDLSKTIQTSEGNGAVRINVTTSNTSSKSSLQNRKFKSLLI